MNGAALETRKERFCPCGVSFGKLSLYEMVAMGGRCDFCDRPGLREPREEYAPAPPSHDTNEEE